MTGYGRVKEENDLREITVELRSVNHRYLDLNIKVPRIYGYLEDVVSKRAQAAIARGKVDIFVAVRAKEGADIKVTPNMAVIQGYVDAIKKVSETYGVSDEVSALSLLRLPDAMEQNKEEADADQLLTNRRTD